VENKAIRFKVTLFVKDSSNVLQQLCLIYRSHLAVFDAAKWFTVLRNLSTFGNMILTDFSSYC